MSIAASALLTSLELPKGPEAHIFATLGGPHRAHLYLFRTRADRNLGGVNIPIGIKPSKRKKGGRYSPTSLGGPPSYSDSDFPRLPALSRVRGNLYVD